MGDDFHLCEGHGLDELAGDAIIERSTGRKHDRGASAQGHDPIDDGTEWLRPFMLLGRAVAYECQKALRADDDLGLREKRSGPLREALKTIFAHADDGEPFRHMVIPA